jgi:glycosyltransferase involved in cell wall biosynthesis
MATNPKSPLVSMVCWTYNHEKYIAQTLESFIAQKAPFGVEILIHDDASTDGTPEIIRSYGSRHPNLIRAVLQTENQFSQRKPFWQEFLASARGKYLASCEGDDFWTDPEKLQKQVEVLEREPTLVGCHHYVNILDEASGSIISGHTLPYFPDRSADVDDFISTLSVPHLSALMVRNSALKGFKSLNIGTCSGDLALALYAGVSGRFSFLSEFMSTYRLHQGGWWSSKTSWERARMTITGLEHVCRQLDLAGRESYRIGQTRSLWLYSQLARREGHYVLALLSYLKALAMAPFRMKRQMLAYRVGRGSAYIPLKPRKG